MDSYTDLDAWKVGMDLVDEVYEITKKCPPTETYGMTAQMRKSSASILANIAEGFGRYTYPDKANKYTIARGECSETEAFLHVAVRVKLVDAKRIEKALQLTDREGKLLSGLISACRKRS